MTRSIRASQRGDTLVEVLLAIAVVSSVLAISYSIMNRTLLTIRDNQERTEATKLAQAQIESIRGASSLPSLGTNFCINGGTVTTISSSDIDFSDPSADNIVDIPTACGGGGGGSVPPGNIYRTVVQSNAVGNVTVYTVYVRWIQLSTSRHSQVALSYGM